MPLTFADIQGFLTPWVPSGTGDATISAAVQNLLQARQAEEARRANDLLAAHNKRIEERALANQNAQNQEKLKRLAFDILKAKAAQEDAQKSARSKALLDYSQLALVNPTAAQAYLANEGLLARRQPSQGANQPLQGQAQGGPVQAAPAPQIRLPQAAVDAGMTLEQLGLSPQQMGKTMEPLQRAATPTFQTAAPSFQTSAPEFQAGTAQPQPPETAIQTEVAPQFEAYQSRMEQPEEFAIGVGGQEFGFSPQADMDIKANAVIKVFEEAFANAPEKDKQVAQQVLAMAPAVVEATSGDTKAALETLQDFYTKLTPKKEGKKEGGGGISIPSEIPSDYWKIGKRSLGSKKDQEVYFKTLNYGKEILNKNQLFRDKQSLNNLLAAKGKLEAGGSFNAHEAIIMMINVYQDRISDKDYKLGTGLQSIKQQIDRFMSVNLNPKADLPDSIKEPMIKGLVKSFGYITGYLKNNYNLVKSSRDSAEYLSEAKAYDFILKTEFNHPALNWNREDKGSVEPSTGSSQDQPTKKSRGNLLDEIEARTNNAGK